MLGIFQIPQNPQEATVEFFGTKSGDSNML